MWNILRDNMYDRITPMCRCRLLLGCMLALIVSLCFVCGHAFAGEETEYSSRDAYIVTRASPSGNFEWRLGTSLYEKTFMLSGQVFLLSSYKNKATSPAIEYISAPVTEEPRVQVNGEAWAESTHGWVCEGTSVEKLALGELKLEIVVKKSTVRLTRHYIIYPGSPVIREWSTIENAGDEEVKLAEPGILKVTVLGGQINSDLNIGTYTHGRQSPGGQRLEFMPLSDGFSHTLTSTASSQHLPWIVLIDHANSYGMFAGWDYLGLWEADLSASDSKGFHLGVKVAEYNRALSPGEAIDTPLAFMGVFSGDLDAMGNAILDWQYEYLWEHKNPAFFAQPRFAVDWPSPWFPGLGGTEDNWSCRLNLDLYFTDLCRYTGAGVLWDDAGWYDEWGSWNGPDFSHTNRYLDIHGMKHMIWMPTYLRHDGCEYDRDMKGTMTVPDWYVDQSMDAAIDWQLNLLDRKVAQWGGFQWRYDFFPASGSDALVADQQFRRFNRSFLDAHPDLAIDACDGGGNWIGVDLASYASSGEMTDGGVHDYSGYHTSLFIPPDILHNVIDFGYHTHNKSYDIRSHRIHLRMNPVWFGDPGSNAPYQAKFPNTDYRAGTCLAVREESLVHLENIRRDWDLYRYFLDMGVVGRWSHVFRPTVSGDDNVLYFQRMNREGSRGVILTTRPYESPEPLKGEVTIYPNGLAHDLLYEVRFDFNEGVSRETGGTLMRIGISMTDPHPGEIVFLNLPDYPGSGTDHKAPSAPTNVVQRVATNIFTQGIEVNWKPSRDNNWLSYYEVFRIDSEGTETNLGKVARGTYLFDRSMLMSELADFRYEVRAVDGDGNTSRRERAKSVKGEAETHYGFSGYGNTQGFRSWHYELTWDSVAWNPMDWKEDQGYEGQWIGPGKRGAIARTYMLAHDMVDMARVFEVTRGGAVTLEVVVKKDMPVGMPLSEDCQVRVMKNDSQVWPEHGWQGIPVDREGVAYSIPVEVQEGDRIYHVIRKNRDYLASGIAWNPVVRYVE